MRASQCQVLLRDIVGQPCGRALNGYGSILTLDFGSLVLVPDDPPGVGPRGWRSITVQSPWRLQSAAEIICDWNTSGGPNGAIQPVIQQLLGRRVLSAETAPPAWDLQLRWENAWTLMVFGSSTHDRDSAWFITGTDIAAVGAVPILSPSAY